jgi:hypothetical protein
LRERRLTPLGPAGQKPPAPSFRLRDPAVRARKKTEDGTYYISPKALDSYEVTKTGPAPQLRVRVAPLAVCIGNAEGKSFRLKHPGELADKTDVEGGHIVAGRIPRWRRVAVLSGRRGDYRFAEIAPADTENEYRFGPFYVRGRFDMKKINDSERAYDAWKAFEPE